MRNWQQKEVIGESVEYKLFLVDVSEKGKSVPVLLFRCRKANTPDVIVEEVYRIFSCVGWGLLVQVDETVPDW